MRDEEGIVTILPWMGPPRRNAPGHLYRCIKRCSGALFEIAECEDPSAQLRERAVFGQWEAADLLRRLFFATSFDLAPVVLGIPVPVRPMLHLVSSLCLHLLPPMLRAAARVQIVFGDNRASRANYCEFLSRCVAAFASWLRRARPPSVARATLGPALFTIY